MIPQDPHLFHSSLRSNLDPASQHSDDQIWSALDKAQMREVVAGLNGGLQHMVEEGEF